jgi:hypothetical protein
MRVIEARNVNQAYAQAVDLVRSQGIVEESRAGQVLAMRSPVVTVYSRPQERVLFEPQRAANPFFHLMESIWMLAGRRDATWLDQYVSDFSSRFAEDDGDAHGAYGHRWRRHFGGDQLLKAGELLLRDPTTRQAVIAMWDPDQDLGAIKRDIPCNDMIMLRSRRDHLDDCWELDMTVLCRSNDVVWGCYGANAVHMSMVHEVLAQLSGMRIGRYTQFSNNWHAYTEVLDKVASGSLAPTHQWDAYSNGLARAMPLFECNVENSPRDEMAAEARAFLIHCEAFCRERDSIAGNPRAFYNGRSIWFKSVAVPMQLAHVCMKSGDFEEAMVQVSKIEAEDWQLAAQNFVERRRDRATKIEEARSR